MRDRRLPRFASLALLGSLACSTAIVEKAATPPIADGGAADAGNADAGRSPKDICAEYIQCANAVSPTKGSTAVLRFGSASACWQGTQAEAEVCANACETEMKELAKSSKNPACGAVQCPGLSAEPTEGEQCMADNCCAEYTACNAGAICTKFQQRISTACAPYQRDVAAYQECANAEAKKDPEGAAAYQAYVSCGKTHTCL